MNTTPALEVILPAIMFPRERVHHILCIVGRHLPHPLLLKSMNDDAGIRSEVRQYIAMPTAGTIEATQADQLPQEDPLITASMFSFNIGDFLPRLKARRLISMETHLKIISLDVLQSPQISHESSTGWAVGESGLLQRTHSVVQGDPPDFEVTHGGLAGVIGVVIEEACRLHSVGCNEG